jgi:hypothetical protein
MYALLRACLGQCGWSLLQALRRRAASSRLRQGTPFEQALRVRDAVSLNFRLRHFDVLVRLTRSRVARKLEPKVRLRLVLYLFCTELCT